jgi:hypothetical protein
MKLKHMEGLRFGRLVVLSRVASTKEYRATWLCRCDCGNTLVVNGKSLRSGNTQSCGCLKHDVAGAHLRTHGQRYHSAYSNWKAMMTRCYNYKSDSYPPYGGAGIRVCEFLRATPANLVVLLGEKPTPRHTIDRINGRKHYSCGQCAECLKCDYGLNVRWATYKEQNRNHAANHLLTWDGRTQCIAAWAEETGVPFGTIFSRIKRGLLPFQSHRIRLPNGRFSKGVKVSG